MKRNLLLLFVVCLFTGLYGSEDKIIIKQPQATSSPTSIVIEQPRETTIQIQNPSSLQKAKQVVGRAGQLSKQVATGTAQAGYNVGTHTLGLIGNSFDYTKDLLLHGFDSTRSLNIAVARARDGVKASYYLTGSWDGYEQQKDILNTPPIGTSGFVADLYLGNKSKVGEQAQVRLGADLGQEEQKFIQERTQHIKKWLPRVFRKPIMHQAVEANIIPRIAVCASGGGFRAMMATAGLLKALEKSDIIHTVMFMSVLSGSTWVTVPRALGKPLDALIDGYTKYAKLPFSFSPKTLKQVATQYPQMAIALQPTDYCMFPEQQVIRDNLLRKFYFEQPIDGMDLYGPVIAHMVLAPFDDPELIKKYPLEHATPLIESRQRVLFSQAQITLSNNDYGEFPLPIATAVSPVKGMLASSKQQLTKSRMQWFEFSPYEMGAEYFGIDGKKHGAFVPTWAMGRKFAPQYQNSGWLSRLNPFGKEPILKGIYSVDNAPELPLPNLLATWGSAFAFSPTDLIRILGYDNLLPGTSLTSPDTVFKKIMGLMATAFAPISSLFGNFRAFPSTIHSFMQYAPATPQKDVTTTLIDAGIDFNLPFPPLLRAARAVDVIMVLDAGMPVFVKDKKTGKHTIEALELAEKWAKAQGVPFPQIVGSEAYYQAINLDEQERAEHPITVFKGINGAPTIIFVPLVDNKQSDATEFKVKKCFEEDCNTFNFRYSEENIRGVVGHVESTVLNNVDLIGDAIADVVRQKMGK